MAPAIECNQDDIDSEENCWCRVSCLQCGYTHIELPSLDSENLDPYVADIQTWKSLQEVKTMKTRDMPEWNTTMEYEMFAAPRPSSTTSCLTCHGGFTICPLPDFNATGACSEGIPAMVGNSSSGQHIMNVNCTVIPLEASITRHVGLLQLSIAMMVMTVLVALFSLLFHIKARRMIILGLREAQRTGEPQRIVMCRWQGMIFPDGTITNMDGVSLGARMDENGRLWTRADPSDPTSGIGNADLSSTVPSPAAVELALNTKIMVFNSFEGDEIDIYDPNVVIGIGVPETPDAGRASCSDSCSQQTVTQSSSQAVATSEAAPMAAQLAGPQPVIVSADVEAASLDAESAPDELSPIESFSGGG